MITESHAHPGKSCTALSYVCMYVSLLLCGVQYSRGCMATSERSRTPDMGSCCRGGPDV